MALTPEQIEGRLKALEAENRELREGARQVNPFENLEIQLALENGHTVSARTRYLQLTATQFAAAHLARWADGSSTTNRYGFIMPADWVVDTDLTLNILLHSTGTGTIITDSQITAHVDDETQSLGNIANDTGLSTSMTATKVNLYSRTITGTTVSDGQILQWAVTRDGANGSDNLAANLDAFYGAYLSYTAFF